MQGLALRMPEREQGVDQLEHYKHAECAGQYPDRRPEKDDRPGQRSAREPNIDRDDLQAADELSWGRWSNVTMSPDFPSVTEVIAN